MLSRMGRWLRTWLLRPRVEREMREEMAAHLDRATERLMARGLSSAAARRAALREFGNVDVVQKQARDARGGRWLASVVADVRVSVRHCRRTPGSTVTMMVLLSLAIGCNSALFTVISSMVRMPPAGIARDASLVRIRGLEHARGAGRTAGREFSYPEYVE